MKKKLIGLLIAIIAIIVNTYGQEGNSPKVKGEYNTEKLKKIQHLQYDVLEPKEQALTKIDNQLPLLPDGGFENDDNVERLQRYLATTEHYIAVFESGAVLTRCKEITELHKQLFSLQGSTYTSDDCAGYEHDIKKAKRNAERLRNRLAKLSGKKVEDNKIKPDEKAKTDKHNAEMTELDRQIEAAKHSADGSRDAIKQYENRHKSQSLDDFLATSPHRSSTQNTTGDFLASKPSSQKSQSDDFLASDNQNNKDFLSGNQNTTKGKIQTKGNQQGVISPTGKILIPFREWKIEAYKNGIAKVAITVGKYSCTGYDAEAHKVGFVDQTGNFLDGFQIEFKDEKYNWVDDSHSGPVIRLTTDSRADVNRSHEAYERRQREMKRRFETEKAQCTSEIASWEKQILNQYKK